MDGLQTNVSMSEGLGCCFKPESLKTWFTLEPFKRRIYIIFDACHMLKLIRNALGLDYFLIIYILNICHLLLILNNFYSTYF